MSCEEGPSKEGLEEPRSSEELLRIRAWEVRKSPVDLGYSPVEAWPKLPNGWKLGSVAGVASDSEGRYYVFHRGEAAPPLLCFDREGELLGSWGEGVYTRPHMAKCDGEDNVWLIDDGGHVLYLYAPDGELLRTLGTRGVPGEDGAHFNRPTDIAFGLDGCFYVSDGYGNSRVARFDRDLNFLGQWGSKGEGEGQFLLPHALATDGEGRVYVADRTNWRVEIFAPGGEFLKQWTHVGKPYGIVRASDGFFYVCDGDNARVTKLDLQGEVVGFFGEPGEGLGQLSGAHDITVADNGDILVAHLDGRAQLFIRR